MHHSDELKGLRAAQAAQQELLKELQGVPEESNLGATGLHPEGKLEPHDKGELRFAVNDLKGKVVLNFGRPVAYVGMNPQQARELASALQKHARKAERQSKPSKPLPPKPGSYR